MHEPHAGYTFCSLGALNFINRLRLPKASLNISKLGPQNPQEVVRWLVYRQTAFSDPDALLDSEFIGQDRGDGNGGRSNDHGQGIGPAYQPPDQTVMFSPFDIEAESAGMNGRTNKVADTCYAWWAGASLHLLGQPDLYDHKAIRHYLLERTQHPVLGGFGKFPGDLPDLYHSCLGLAALSLAGGGEVKELDPGMCISKEAAARIEKLREAWSTAESKT